MPYKSKGGKQMKCTPWSSKLGDRGGANYYTPGYLLLRNHGENEESLRVVEPMRKMSYEPP
jgi:hypothetical protein